jgi:hypothetical protein
MASACASDRIDFARVLVAWAWQGEIKGKGKKKGQEAKFAAEPRKKHHVAVTPAR